MSFVYVLDTHRVFENRPIYKIGITINPEQRIKCYQTGIPFCQFSILYPVCHAKVEKGVHFILDTYRVHKCNEFFACSLNKIRKIIELVNEAYHHTIFEDDDNMDLDTSQLNLSVEHNLKIM